MRRNEHRFCVRLGKMIRAEREKKGLLQAEVAKKIGRTQSWVARVEAGENKIAFLELVAFARAIKFDLPKMVSSIWNGGRPSHPSGPPRRRRAGLPYRHRFTPSDLSRSIHGMTTVMPV